MKVITDRLKVCVPSIITENQSAFVLDRMITDNILVAFEIYHDMASWLSNWAWLQLWMEWNGLFYTLSCWIRFSVLIGSILWKGAWKLLLSLLLLMVSPDVLLSLVEAFNISSCLFLFSADGVSYLLNEATLNDSIKGYWICQEALPISHLLFVDDSVIFCGANNEEAQAVKDLLYLYEAASGQKINLSNSNILFWKGIPYHRRNKVLVTSDIREVLSY